MRNSNPALNFLVALLLTAALPACFEPVEGCLDVSAVNYQVDADEPCPDCCAYPQIKLDVLHKIVLPDTALNLEYDTEYRDGAGNPFQISRIEFYLSDLQLIRPNGDSAGVIDTLLLPFESPDGAVELVEVKDHFALLDPGDFAQQQLGRIQAEGLFASLRFTLGVAGLANLIPPAAYPEEHPLAEPALYVDAETGRLLSRLQLYRIEGAADTLRTDIRIAASPRFLALPLEPPAFQLDPGFSPRIRLQVDYLTWFDGVDLAADSEEQIASKIVINMTDSFSVINVTEENQ